MKDLKRKIESSWITQKVYRAWFYFTTGKAQADKFTAPLQEMGSVVVILTMVLGVDLKQHKALLGLVFLCIIATIALTGYFFKHSGLWDTEQKVLADKNPVRKDIWDAALIIKEKYGKK